MFLFFVTVVGRFIVSFNKFMHEYWKSSSDVLDLYKCNGKLVDDVLDLHK